MRVAYLLDRPELGGGVRVVFRHAALLRRSGVDAWVLGHGPRPDWEEDAGPYVDVRRAASVPSGLDLLVATFWTTLNTAQRLEAAPVAHFCQGYEGWQPHHRHEWPEIRQAYEVHLPTLVVTPFLGELLAERHARRWRLAPPSVDAWRTPPPRSAPGRRPTVVVSGAFEAEVKGIATALAAVKLLRHGGIAARLVRISVLPLSDEERSLLEPDRYLYRITPAQVKGVLAEADLLLLPSRREEGFGLPALEAMGAGVPVVATRIPSMEFLGQGTLPLVPDGDAATMAAAAAELLTSARTWRCARDDQWEAAQTFRPTRVAEQVLEAVTWAAGGGAAGEGA